MLGFRGLGSQQGLDSSLLACKKSNHKALPEGPRDLVTTYNLAYTPTYNPPEWAIGVTPNYM